MGSLLYRETFDTRIVTYTAIASVGAVGSTESLIRLFSIAFPGEWNNGRGSDYRFTGEQFYNLDGTRKHDALIIAYLMNRFAVNLSGTEVGRQTRDWAHMPEALVNIARYYMAWDVRNFGASPERIHQLFYINIFGRRPPTQP